MPPWLEALLQQHSTKGLVDSLAVLVGVMPGFAQLPSANREAEQLGGKYYANAVGKPTIGLTQFTIDNFGQQASGGRPDYIPVDKKQRVGERVLAHEFGHVAVSGAGDNTVLTDQLLQAFPDAVESEKFAQDFQNTIQFLRSNNTDTKLLSPEAKKLLSVLLQQPLFAQHPINTSKAFGALIQRH